MKSRFFLFLSRTDRKKEPPPPLRTHLPSMIVLENGSGCSLFRSFVGHFVWGTETNMGRDMVLPGCHVLVRIFMHPVT